MPLAPVVAYLIMHRHLLKSYSGRMHAFAAAVGLLHPAAVTKVAAAVAAGSIAAV